ncbi:MAG: [protein-PII] uridylyltransferase [Stagnimonas sp.]|nr:[protein-PII] uridylyltransferase [Stagnimonas sp.]
MTADLDLTESSAAEVFSTRKIRGRLRVTGKPAIATFKETLAWGRERLFGLFNDGAPADVLVHARAQLIDEVLREIWERHVGAADGIALVAVGGYGRGELLPYSDIDLLVLHTPEALKEHSARLEPFFTFLWDIGLEVGSSVRTVDECARIAAEDLTVITNLLESRLLIGDTTLHTQLLRDTAPDKLWPVASFFKAKLEEQRRRHAKYDDSGYKLEPNVKESPGGLRDIHTIAWVAKRHFGAASLTELRDKGFLSKQECDELFAGQDFLWRVRFALHMITGRHEDRLLFDHQVRVASLFGYIDAPTNGSRPDNRAVEQFMQLYYRTIKSLSCLNDMLLQLFEEAILGAGSDGKVNVLNARFQIRGTVIEARDEAIFTAQPWALIEVFTLMQSHPEVTGIRAQTLRLIRRDLRLLDDSVRADLRTKSLFIELFRNGDGLTHGLRRMNRYGVLGRYLPAFGRIVGHMQYDLFHTLTVDEHILYVVRNARRLAMRQFADELPFPSEVFTRLPKPELLYLAAFFHDLAKGRGGDHSELGGADAVGFCLDHGLSHADAELVAWLVRHHLTMSLTAQKQDVQDPQVIATFTKTCDTRERLDYLYLLTVSDIRGTNPKLWNGWRDSLLKELYKATARALDRGLDSLFTLDQRAEANRKRALDRSIAEGIDGAAAAQVFARIEPEYFLRHTADELAWHLPEILIHPDAPQPLVLVKNFEDRGTSVFIYCRDRDHLFGLTTGVLSSLGLNILDARLHTTADGYVLDSYVVLESDGSPITGDHRMQEIVERLARVISDPAMTVVDVNRRMSTRLRHFNTPTTVHISQDAARGRTVLELVAADQPGLLSMIGRVFHKRGILLDAAKIATIGERAEDVFYLTDRAHQPLRGDALLEELREVLIRTLDRTDS